MTPVELDAEKVYRREERLGILCGSDEPTRDQIEIAENEAGEVVRKLREANE